MRCARRVLPVFLLALAWVGTAPPAVPAEPAPAKLDEVFQALAAYDFGVDNAPLTRISELVAATQGRPAERQQLAARLVAVLTSGAARGAKDFACRQLSLIGTDADVPALAALLTDEHLAHMARFALERIPGPAANEALRQALGKVQGKLLVGVVNSLGNRRDQHAVSELAKLIGHSDAAVACAAAAALGKIGPAAASVLGQALADASGPVRASVADACVVCAEQLLGEGKREQAVALYDRVRQADVPQAARIAATRGAILARQEAGAALLVEQLKAPGAEWNALGLLLIREAPGAQITKAVAAELGALAPERQVAVVQALSDRGDLAATPAVLRLAREGEGKVRAAATLALTRLADASVVPLLVDAAAGPEAELAQAALAALAGLPGKEVNAAILSVLDRPDAKARRVAIEVLGQRRASAATPVLLKAAADADESIRLAAVKALGETAVFADLPALVELLAKAKAANELAVAEAALRTACARVPDKEAAAQRLAAGLAQAGPDARSALLRTLGQLGGAKALEAVRAAVQDANEAIRDTALRVLADWPDPAASPALLDLAKTSDNAKHKILALRGFIRLIARSEAAADQKLAMCKEAMNLAQRDEEKKLVLGALGGVPLADALAIVVPHLDAGAMKDEASAAAVSIAEKIAGSHPAPVTQAMNRVLEATTNQDLQQRARRVLLQTQGK